MLKTPAGQFDIDSDLACRDVSGKSRRPADDSERTHILVAVDLPACDPDDHFVTIEAVLQINADSRHFPAHPPDLRPAGSHSLESRTRDLGPSSDSPLRCPLYQHVGRIDGWGSFNGIYPRQHEHIIILANSEATSVLDIGTILAALTLG